MVGGGVWGGGTQVGEFGEGPVLDEGVEGRGEGSGFAGGGGGPVVDRGGGAKGGVGAGHDALLALLSVFPTARVARLVVALSARVQGTIGRIPLKFGRNSPALRWLIAIKLARGLREWCCDGCSALAPAAAPRYISIESPKPALMPRLRSLR